MGGAFNNAPIYTTQAYGLQVARGEIGGSKPFGSFGKITTGGAVSKRVIWPNGTFTFPNQTTGETISFVSTDAQDSAAGTGIREIEVHYLDADLNEQHAVIPLTGLTPVVSALTGVRFIQCMHIQTAGSGLAAAGTITAYREGSPTIVFSLISAGDERCSSSLRMVPKGKRAIVVGLVGSSISGTAAARADIEVCATELDTHQYVDPFILIPFGSIGVQDTGLSYNLPVPVAFRENTVIGMRVSTDKGADVSGDWFGWIEDTPPA